MLGVSVLTITIICLHAKDKPNSGKACTPYCRMSSFTLNTARLELYNNSGELHISHENNLHKVKEAHHTFLSVAVSFDMSSLTFVLSIFQSLDVKY